MKTLKAIKTWCCKPIPISRIRNYVNNTFFWSVTVLAVADLMLRCIDTNSE
jgi:hypothetical protein